jgi:hypothetical protein
VLSALGAQVIDRELPIGMVHDAFDGERLADPDHALALGSILEELCAKQAELAVAA